jgi:GNAT superfamily N-acetyltransferase
MSVAIRRYSDDVRDRVIGLILPIQTVEFGVPTTLLDQPDLADVPTHYGRGNGAFWVATDGDEVVGSIALLDIGDASFALRKMFVHRNYRGKEIGVAAKLFATARAWAEECGYKRIILGTTGGMLAAHRFYEKNGFVRLNREELPANFPQVRVDTVFFLLSL